MSKSCHLNHAGVAVLCGDSVLLAKRIETYLGEKVSFGGYWSIFAGALNANEGIKEGAARELLEESGIVSPIKDLQFIGSIDNKQSLLHVHCYSIEEIVIPKLNFEHTEFGWFKISLLDSFTNKIDLKLINLIKKHVH